jgi:hypothetical protein
MKKQRIYITPALLNTTRACNSQIRKFKRLFGNSAELTLKNMLKAYKAGLNVFWLERLLFTDKQYTRFEYLRRKYTKDLNKKSRSLLKDKENTLNAYIKLMNLVITDSPGSNFSEKVYRLQDKLFDVVDALSYLREKQLNELTIQAEIKALFDSFPRSVPANWLNRQLNTFFPIN